MEPVKVGTSWRIKTETGALEGWYMSHAQALKGIDKRLRDRVKNTTAAKSSVELELISREYESQVTYLVKVDGVKRGLINQFKPELGVTHPWKAFALGCLGSTEPNHMYGVFYGPNGQQQAIEAVVKGGK